MFVVYIVLCVCVLRASCCSASCCVLCSIRFMFVNDAKDDHMDEAYSMVVRTTAL